MDTSQERQTRAELALARGDRSSCTLEWGGSGSILIGDHIETQGNADCLQATAAMFGWDFGLLAAHADAMVRPDGARIASSAALEHSGLPIIAIENANGAENLFHYRPPDGPYAVVVGNERKGISRQLIRRADHVVQIPSASRHINTINVAAAAGVALYYLSHRGGLRATREHAGSRPHIMLAGTSDAIELGSAVRTAAFLGWSQLFVPKCGSPWFAADRVTRSLGRGAARRGRNPIHVIPMPEAAAFDEVCIVTAHGDGTALPRVDLAAGTRQLVIIAGESTEDIEQQAARLGCRVQRARVDVERGARCPFRSIASIALAEIARQVGSWRRGPSPRSDGASRRAGRISATMRTRTL